MWSKRDLSHHEEPGAVLGDRPVSDRLALAVLGAVVLFGAFQRIVCIDGVFLQGDEFHSLELLPRGYLEILSTYDMRGSGVALPLLQRLPDLRCFGRCRQAARRAQPRHRG